MGHFTYINTRDSSLVEKNFDERPPRGSLKEQYENRAKAWEDKQGGNAEEEGKQCGPN